MDTPRDPARAAAARSGATASNVIPAGTQAPAMIAKAALRRLAMSKLEPTPENYARAYAEEAGEAVASGEAALGLSFMSEFVANPALTVVPFPEPLQKPQLYTAGVFAGSSNADAARELLAFLTSSAAREKLSAAGVVPSNSSADSVR